MVKENVWISFILVEPVREQFVTHGHRVLREQALQSPIAPIHQHQWILGRLCWRIRMVVNRGRITGKRRSLHAIGPLLERVSGGCWEWMLLLLLCAVFGLVCRVGIDHSGSPSHALAISRRLLLLLLLLMPDAVVRLSRGSSDILRGRAQRAVGLERLL